MEASKKYSISLSEKKVKDILNIIFPFAILIMILFSKTMWFGVKNRDTFQFLFYGLSILVCILASALNKKLIKNLVLLVPMLLIFAIQIVFLKGMLDDGVNTILGYTFTFLSCALIASSITAKKFSKYYVYIMVILCLFSLPFYFIANFNQNLAKQLCYTSLSWDNTYEYSWFYTWGRHSYISTRNAGMFWEPGAFQAFIILGILLLLNSYNLDKEKTKRYRWFLVILCFTLLTTQSTTGYILCIVLLFINYRRIVNLFSSNNKYKMFVYISIFIISICLVTFIILTNNISDKMSGVENDSAEIRMNDVISSFQLMFEKGGLIGLGPTNEKLSLELTYNMVSNSAGILSMGYTYGLIFFISYMILLYRGISNFFCNSNVLYKIAIFSIFIILNLSEGLWFLPVFAVFIFNFKKDEQGEMISYEYK